MCRDEVRSLVLPKLKKIKPSSPPVERSAATGDAGSRRRLLADLRIVLAVAVICAAAFFTYRESNSGRLFFDDHSAIENNSNVHALVDPATRWKWKTWVYAASSAQESPLSGRPVVSLSFALNHWWASAMHPSPIEGHVGMIAVHVPYFHYVNLALHMLVALLLFALVRRTMLAPPFGETFRETADIWAFCVALIWAVHPLNTEAVVYVTQRTEQVVSLFLLLTLYCSTRALDAATTRRRLGWEAAAVVACLLGMASKENMIAAPLLVVAYDRAFRFADWRTTFRSRRWFYLALALTWILLWFIMATNPRGASVGFADERLPWYEYLITQCWCLWRYFWLTVIPLGSQLCVDYGRRPVLEFQHTAPGAALVFTLLGLTIWGWFRRPWIGFLGTWFFFILAPTSSFYPIVTEIGAERRMYLPSAAVLVALVAGLVAVAQFLRSQTVDTSAAAHSVSRRNYLTLAGLAVTAGLAVLLGYTSHHRNKIYQDDLTLYGHIVRVFPQNDRGCNNYGKVAMDAQLTEEALGMFNRAVKIDPEYVDAFTNRANVFMGAGARAQYDLSIADSTAALNWQPWGNARNNRALAYMGAKLFARAQADFKMLTRANPYDYGIRLNQANMFLQMGEDDPKYFDEALKSIDEAIALQENSYRTYEARGHILYRMKKPEQAVAAFQKAIDKIREGAKLLPADSPAAANWKLVDKGLNSVTPNPTSASVDLREAAVQFSQKHLLSDVFSNLGRAYELWATERKQPKYRRNALQEFTRAIFLESDNFRHYYFRGECYLEMDRPAEAMQDFDSALRLAELRAQEPNWIPGLQGKLRAAIGKQEFDTAKATAERLRKLGVPLDAASSAALSGVGAGP
jgi:tetratricopeptide (TPR) repeat protein